MSNDGKVHLYSKASVPGVLLAEGASPAAGVATADNCCCCTCVCENCLDYTAACCWEVTVYMLDDEGDPTSYKWSLDQDPSDNCRWYSAKCPAWCGEMFVDLVVSATKITVTMGDFTWEKDYGTTPDCCSFSDRLPNIGGENDDCEVDPSNDVLINALKPHCTGPCTDICVEGHTAPCLAVNISGMEIDPSSCLVGGDDHYVGDCDCYDSTFYLPCTDCAAWLTFWGSGGGALCYESGSMSASISKVGDDYIMTIVMYKGTPWGNYSFTFTDNLGEDLPDCRTLSGTAERSGSELGCYGGTASYYSVMGACNEWDSSTDEAIDHLCTSCGTLPDTVSITLAGWSNYEGLSPFLFDPCEDCDDINGTYVLTRSSSNFCIYTYEFTGTGPCLFERMRATFSLSPIDNCYLNLGFEVYVGSPYDCWMGIGGWVGLTASHALPISGCNGSASGNNAADPWQNSCDDPPNPPYLDLYQRCQTGTYSVSW